MRVVGSADSTKGIYILLKVSLSSWHPRDFIWQSSGVPAGTWTLNVEKYS